MPDSPDLPDFEPDTLLYASDLREVVDALRNQITDYGDKQFTDTRAPGDRTQPSQRRPIIVEQWIGRVTLTPPIWSTTGTDFADARYYVAKQVSTNKAGDDQYDSTDDQQPNTLEGSAPVARQTFVATNLDEVTPDADPPAGTHLLKSDSLVRVCGIYTRGQPDIKVYVFSRAVPELLDVDLTQNGGTDGDGAPTPTYATYTYDVAYNGVTLSDPLTPLSPTWARDIGPLNPATKGTARYVAGVLTLLTTDERTKGDACSS